jgi:predicted short-subunit dehydrogenase-like oxidoreductase (DUF2520 family)
MEIVILGSGNVAFHLGTILGKFHNIVQVYARNPEKACNIANKLDSKAISSFSEINKKADLYLICVKDNAIEEVSNKLKIVSGVVAHCSGSIGIEVFSKKFHHFGVFYPLMTFSQSMELKVKSFPLCIEGSDLKTVEILTKLGNSISLPCFEINSEKRKNLHLAAITVNNFTNYLYSVAFDFLKENQTDSGLLFPLMEETFRKAISHNPKEIQTGPAKRKDSEIIKRHLDLLETYPEYKKLYSFVSEQIFNYHNNKNDGKF